jgi:hypothetical protein
MPVPDFSPGEVLTAAAMDSIGLWLVKTQTVGTGVSSVTVSDAFSSTYDSYRVVMTNTVLSAGGGGLRFVLGASIPGANYYWGSVLINPATAAIVGAVGNNSGFVLMGTSTGSNAFSNSFDVMNPNRAARTNLNGFQAYSETGGVGTGSAFHNADTAFTSFSFYPASGTMTGGTIRVYGYRD